MSTTNEAAKRRHTRRSGSGLTRRSALGVVAAGVATVTHDGWLFALAPGNRIVVRAAEEDETYRPELLDAEQLEAVARMVDALIPKTETPGARDARVHEYIDLAVSVDDAEDREAFLEGLAWMRARCRSEHGVALESAAPAQVEALLREVSDEQDEPAPELAPGAAFFATLKGLTIRGYYTSYEGRVEELGLPDAVTMERWRGCRHPPGTHEA